MKILCTVFLYALSIFLYITNWLIPIFLVAKCRIGAVFAYDLIKKKLDLLGVATTQRAF